MATPSSSLKYQRMEEQEEDDHDPTARAYASISEALKHWTSPVDSSKNTNVASRMVYDGDDEEDDEDLVMINKFHGTASGSASSSSARRQDNDDDDDDDLKVPDGLVDWLKREIHSSRPSKTMMEDEELVGEVESKKSALFPIDEEERASTPVTSNSSNKKPRHRSTMSSDSNNSDYYKLAATTPVPKTPMGVVSPWNQEHPVRLHASSSMPPPTPMALASPTAAPRTIAALEHPSHEYRRYHDAILALKSARLSIDARLALIQQEVTTMQEPMDDGDDDTFLRLPASYTSYMEDLVQEEKSMELSFLQSLFMTCWDRSTNSPRTTASAAQQQPSLDLQSQKEATLWMLLYHLRSGGLTTLIWPDDTASYRQTNQALQQYLNQCATTNIQSATPAEILQALQQTASQQEEDDRASLWPSPPLLLQRRKLILDWLHHFFDRKMILTTKQQSQQQQLGEFNKMSTIMSVWSLPDAPALVSEFDNNNGRGRTHRGMYSPEADRMESNFPLFSSCLEYVLAGRLEDAQAYCRRHPGQAWRAAQLGGGAAWGKSSTAATATGNPARAAWKRQMWKLSQQCYQALASSSSSSRSTTATAATSTCWEEAAIYAILSQDVKNALSNRALRTWEHGLFVSLDAMWGRMEDEVLHRHYDYRRQQYVDNLPQSSLSDSSLHRRLPAFPGMSYERAETEQLRATGDVASMDESTILRTLSVSPWEEMRGNDPLSMAMSAFLLGKAGVMEYMNGECGQRYEVDATHLRVLTHLALYLDSLSASTTPLLLDNIHQIRNDLLYSYVQHLSQYPELWHMLVLYSSFLPEDTMVDKLPEVLVEVQNDGERKGIVDQMKNFLPAGLDLIILKRLVRLILSSSSSSSDAMAITASETSTSIVTMSNSNTNSTPSRSDTYKMKAIGWLCNYEDHLGDALICSNLLIRQFLSSYRMKSAQWFLQEYCAPLDFEGEVEGAIVQQEQQLLSFEDNDKLTTVSAEENSWNKRIEEAQSEYSAYQSYISAFVAVEEWKTTLKNTSPLSGNIADVEVEEDLVEGNSERAAALYMDRRALLKAKRKACEAVVNAAEMARDKLLKVSTHPRGWLLEDDIDNNNGTTTRMQEDVDEDMIEEDERRHDELKQLRAHHLPMVVSMMHLVCDETAQWLACLLDACVPRLAKSPQEALIALDDTAAATSTTMAGTSDINSTAFLTSALSPKFWSQHAMDLCVLVASDAHNIHTAFGADDIKELLGKIAETAVKHLQYEA